MDVFGYQTQNFDICPGAVAQYATAIQTVKQKGPLYAKQSEAQLADSAKWADQFLGVEKAAVGVGCKTADNIAVMEGHRATGIERLTAAISPDFKPLGAPDPVYSWEWAPAHLATVEALPYCAAVPATQPGQIPPAVFLLGAAVVLAFFIFRR